MEKNNVKYIVNAGCSYGRMADSITHPKKYVNEISQDEFNGTCTITDYDIVTIDVSVSGQGTDWQSESVIYTVNKLLESGVLPENIYVFIEWSQWSRISAHPFQYFRLDMSPFEVEEIPDDFLHYFHKSNEVVTHHTSEELGLLPIRFSVSDGYNIAKIENTIFLNVNSMESESFYKHGHEYKLFYDETKKIQTELPQELQLRNYFQTIIKTQNFLKLHNIKYNCIHMQSDLSGWYKDEDGVVKHHITHDYDYFTPYGYSSNKSGEYITKNKKNVKYHLQNIEDVYSEFELYIKQIDFDNFYFYNDGKVERGGYDEWCLNEFNEVGFADIHYRGENDFNVFDLLPSYHAHPSFILYQLLWNDVATNCDFFKMDEKYIKYLKQKIEEDYNYDGFTKNGIVISKKWWIDKVNYRNNDTF